MSNYMFCTINSTNHTRTEALGSTQIKEETNIDIRQLYSLSIKRSRVRLCGGSAGVPEFVC